MHSNSSPRRRHSAELKARVLAVCEAPGASISGIALAHGLNANLVRKWRSGRGVKRVGTAITAAAARMAPRAPLGATPEFVAVDACTRRVVRWSAPDRRSLHVGLAKRQRQRCG